MANANWMTGIFSRQAGGLAEKVATFTEARHQVLAHNIANIDTPGYKVRDLPVAEFREMLADAVEKSRKTGGPLRLRSTRHITVEADGRLTFEPIERRDANLLFHDGGNRSVEQEMSEAVKNTVLHRVAVEVMRKQRETLETAIRGRI